MSKRARTGEVIDKMAVVPMSAMRSKRRPIDKQLIGTNLTVSNSNSATTLYTCTFPGTIVGLRWELSALTVITTGQTEMAWVIVVVPDGVSASTPSLSNGADFYTPEQHVLAFGVGAFADVDAGAGQVQQRWSGSTKTMRKLRAGDVLQLITIGDTANMANFFGVVQFFVKT